MQLPLAHLDATAIEEIPLDLWRQVFDAVGWPPSLESVSATITHSDLLTSLQRDEPTDGLLQVLEALHELGTESGREAIMAAMDDRRIPRDSLPNSASERELSVHLFLAQHRDASLADVFARAHAQVQDGAERRRYNDFLGKDARGVANLKAKSAALSEEVLQYCIASDLGDHVNVSAFEDDGSYFFHVIRSHHTKKPLAVVPGRSARATIEFRPVHGDILRYDASLGRLRIAARVASVVQFYRGALGRILFSDESFFSADAVCSLAVLQEKGQDALDDHEVVGVGPVRVTELQWERGDRNLVHLRSSDCMQAVEEMGLNLAEGQLVLAKLKFQVSGESTRPVTVTVRVPSRIEVSQKRHEKLVDELLGRVGIRVGRRSTGEADLWSLYPWRHSTEVWRALFGADVDALVEQRALIPVQLAAVSSPTHPGTGNVLEARQIAPHEFYGVSKAPEVPSRSLTATDLDGLELSPERLRVYLRSRLAVDGPTAGWDGGEVLDIGAIKVGDFQVRVFYALRQPHPGIGNVLSTRSGGSLPVLLVPSARRVVELATVALQRPLPSHDELVREIVFAAGLKDRVPALLTAPNGTRLVVDTQRGKIWVDGIEITEIRSGTQPFRFVEMLAKASPVAVSMRHLTDELSSPREDGDTAARQAKLAAKKRIHEAMSKAGRAFEGDPFPSAGTGCYRCTLTSYLV